MAATCTRACPASSTTSPTTTPTRWRSCASSWTRCPRGSPATSSRRRDDRGAAGVDPSRPVRRGARRHPHAVRRARGDPAARRRQPLPRVQAALRRDAGLRRSPRIWGHEVGIVANNGILFSESALKGAHFIELCNQRGIPLVFLQNITGFMVGKEYENGGIATRRRQAGHRGRLPRRPEVHRRHRRLVRRRQLRHVRPRLRPALPVDVAQRPHLGDGRRAGRLGAGRRCARPRRPGRRDEEAFKEPIREQYEHQGSPYYSTARLWDDGIIDPADTRRVLGMGLAVAAHAPIPERRLRRLPDVGDGSTARPSWSPTAARSPAG